MNMSLLLDIKILWRLLESYSQRNDEVCSVGIIICSLKYSIALKSKFASFRHHIDLSKFLTLTTNALDLYVTTIVLKVRKHNWKCHKYISAIAGRHYKHPLDPTHSRGEWFGHCKYSSELVEGPILSDEANNRRPTKMIWKDLKFGCSRMWI